MKTERVVILMTPEQKRALAHRAKALDLSVGELLRRSAEGVGAGGEEAAFAALAGELRDSVRQSRAAVRAALAEAEATLEYLGRRRKDRRAA